MKLIYKDIIFSSLILIWFIAGIFIWCYTNIDVYAVHVIMIFIFCVVYLFSAYNTKFNKWLYKSPFYYYLTSEENELWESINDKAYEGFLEWEASTNGDDICGPWIKNLTTKEENLLNKIHEKYFDKDWIVTIPVSAAQVNYIMYEDIKDKVIYESKR